MNSSSVSLRLLYFDVRDGMMTETSALRRRVIALILSGVFPGLGQFYTRQRINGAAFLVAGVVLSWFLDRAVPADLRALARPGFNPGTNLIASLCVLLALWLWSVIDAWRVAGVYSEAFASRSGKQRPERWAS